MFFHQNFAPKLFFLHSKFQKFRFRSLWDNLGDVPFKIMLHSALRQEGFPTLKHTTEQKNKFVEEKFPQEIISI